MRLALVLTTLGATAALALGGAAPADAAVPIALGGLGLAVLAGGGGYLGGRARRDQEEHARDGGTEVGPARSGVDRRDIDQDGVLAVPPPYCLWW